uniref:Uncharacterized protein n=1 Tax=Anguilla anguilla TaxID=7936 RepID=A0A0E9VXI5_ANGAN
MGVCIKAKLWGAEIFIAYYNTGKPLVYELPSKYTLNGM